MQLALVPQEQTVATVERRPPPAEGDPGDRPRKQARRTRMLDQWATDQMQQENERLRERIKSLQADVAWAETSWRALADPRDAVRMMQNHDVPVGQFPHQYVQRVSSGGVDVERFVSARKSVRISGKLLASPAVMKRAYAIGTVGATGATKVGNDARASPPEMAVNASVFGPTGLCYTITLIEASSGRRYTAQNYPGIENGAPFLVWHNGDRARDYFHVGPDESAWTVRFRFPHLSYDRKDRIEWRFEFAPRDAIIRTRYPALTFVTDTFRACARLKGE